MRFDLDSNRDVFTFVINLIYHTFGSETNNFYKKALMDPKDVKLNLGQMLKVAKVLLKEEHFPWLMALIVLAVGWNAFMAHWFPVVSNHAFLDALISFSMAILFHATLILPVIIFFDWWERGHKSGRDHYKEFKSALRDETLKMKKKVLSEVDKHLLE